MGKKIVVFGAGGFIGTYLIDAMIQQGYEVIASDISKFSEEYFRDNKVPYLSVDITKKEEFDRIPAAKYDAVINLAAVQPANVSEKTYDPCNYVNVNVIGTLNILEFCRKNGVPKVIYASSHRNTQGLWQKNKAIKEEEGRSAKLAGEYAMFSISETAAQDCVIYYGNEYGMQPILFRLPPVYGYGPHTEIFKEGKPIKTGFQTFIDQAIAGKPLELWGDTSVGRDIIYVKDVVSAFMKVLENDTARGIYNITSGRYLTIREQAELSAKVFWPEGGTPSYVELPEKDHKMDSFLYDNGRAATDFGWRPEYDFEAMLRDIKLEMRDEKFKFLLEKRKAMLEESI